MKKTYQNPTTIVVKVHPILMQAATAKMFGKNAESAGMSRCGGDSFWDDEEDE